MEPDYCPNNQHKVRLIIELQSATQISPIIYLITEICVSILRVVSLRLFEIVNWPDWP